MGALAQSSFLVRFVASISVSYPSSLWPRYSFSEQSFQINQNLQPPLYLDSQFLLSTTSPLRYSLPIQLP